MPALMLVLDSPRGTLATFSEATELAYTSGVVVMLVVTKGGGVVLLAAEQVVVMLCVLVAAGLASNSENCSHRIFVTWGEAPTR